MSTYKVLFHLSIAIWSSILNSNHWDAEPQNQLTVTTYLNEKRKLIIIHNGTWTQLTMDGSSNKHATFPNNVQIFRYFMQNKHVVRHVNLTSGQQKIIYGFYIFVFSIRNSNRRSNFKYAQCTCFCLCPVVVS